MILFTHYIIGDKFFFYHYYYFCWPNLVWKELKGIWKSKLESYF